MVEKKEKVKLISKGKYNRLIKKYTKEGQKLEFEDIIKIHAQDINTMSKCSEEVQILQELIRKDVSSLNKKQLKKHNKEVEKATKEIKKLQQEFVDVQPRLNGYALALKERIDLDLRIDNPYSLLYLLLKNIKK